MKKVVTAIATVLGVFLLAKPSQAHAIVYLPAVILIPVAKIVSVVITGFSLPAVGLGMLAGKLFRKPVAKMIVLSIVTLLIFAVILFIFLKITTPQRPLF